VTENTPLVISLPQQPTPHRPDPPKSKSCAYGTAIPFHAKLKPNPNAHEHEHSPDTRSFFGGHHRHERRGDTHAHLHPHTHGLDDDGEVDELGEISEEIRIGQKRQVVGILVWSLSFERQSPFADIFAFRFCNWVS
jgi:hypothetical protein